MQRERERHTHTHKHVHTYYPATCLDTPDKGPAKRAVSFSTPSDVR